ncbi:hypothetical protein [Nonomuraea dietziae]|uniref:hypothetical protein n=1 Tax=Nonomuraea dietziae TaxID=65515 RepID=UPI003443F909
MTIRRVIPAITLALAATGCGIASAEIAPLRAPEGPEGLVIGREPGTIIVAPWSRERAVRIQVTPEQARACADLESYKICLTEGG